MNKLLLALLLFGCSVLQAQTSLEQSITSIADSYLKNKPGAMIIGIRKAGQNKIYYFGETKPGTKQLPDNSSLFELGELTEIFTTALYSELVFEKVISADDALQTHLPEGIKAPQYTKIICEPVDKDVRFEKDNSMHVTPYVCRPDPSFSPQPIMLCYLANHTSGLPEFPDNLNKKSTDPLSAYSADDLYNFLKGYEFINKVEYAYKYSMLGMGIMGHVMELKTGKPYNELLQEKIAAPLGLTSSFIYKPEDDAKLLNGFSSKKAAVPHQHLGVLGAGTGLSSNITDMMKLLEVNMLTEKSHLADLFAFNQKLRIKSGNKELGLGWQLKDHNNKTLAFQQGKTNGFASYIGLYQEQRIGVVILSSIAKDVDKEGEEILNLLLNQ